MGPATGGVSDNNIRLGNSDASGNWAGTQNVNMLLGGSLGVGIGTQTTAPYTALQVGSDTNINPGTNPKFVAVDEYTSANGFASFRGGWASSGYWGIGPATGSSDNILRIGLAASKTDNRWDATQSSNLLIGGSVGIGNGASNTAPSQALDVTGSGKFSTSVLTPLLDTASATTLNIGTNNATSISLNAKTVGSGNTAGIDTSDNLLPNAGFDSWASFNSSLRLAKRRH